MNALNELYQEVILGHKQNPRNFGTLALSSSHARGRNPVCGDEVFVQLRAERGEIADIAFTGSGCAICIASASLMTVAVKGASLAHAAELFEAIRCDLTDSEQTCPHGAYLGSLVALKGVRAFPSRVKCALLPWHALQECVRSLPHAAEESEVSAEAVVAGGA